MSVELPCSVVVGADIPLWFAGIALIVPALTGLLTLLITAPNAEKAFEREATDRKVARDYETLSGTWRALRADRIELYRKLVSEWSELPLVTNRSDRGCGRLPPAAARLDEGTRMAGGRAVRSAARVCARVVEPSDQLRRLRPDTLVHSFEWFEDDPRAASHHSVGRSRCFYGCQAAIVWRGAVRLCLARSRADRAMDFDCDVALEAADHLPCSCVLRRLVEPCSPCVGGASGVGSSRCM